jgi:adhesin/invasin
VIKTRQRLAFSIGLLLAALVAGCGGDVVLPDEGEAADIEILSGDGQFGQAGAALPDPAMVKVTDTRGRPVANQDVAFSIGSGGGSVAPATVKTDAMGQAAADWTLGPNAGSQLLRVQTARGGSGTLEVTFRATAVAGTGSVLVGVSGDDQTGPVNSALADSLVVKATDALGNPVANVEVTWSVSGGGSITPVTVVTDAGGLAAAERVLGTTAGAQTARATVVGFTGSPVTFSHTAVPANPTDLVLVSGNGQVAPGGFEVAEDLVVRLEDDNGNGIGGRPITWVVPAGAGSVIPVNTTTSANGLATTRWTLPTLVGNYTVSAVFSGLPPVPFTATATADVPTTIEEVSGDNQSAPVGTSLPNPLVVRVTDANDNPVAGVSVNWTAEGGGSVGAATSGTNSSGLAEMTRTVGITPGQYTTTAAVDGLIGSPITFTSTATVGPPARLAIATAPGNPTVSGNAFAPSPVIQVQDLQGNNVGQGGIEVTVEISSGQAGASLVNTERNTNGSGRATFSNLRITGPPDDAYVLTFRATISTGPLLPISTDPLTVTAGAADQLVIIQQPSAAAQSGVPFAQQPTVQVQDASGNPIAGNHSITAEMGQGSGSLLGTVTVNTNGSATANFSGLGISGAVGTKTIIFTSGALSPDESNSITLSAGPASSVAIQAGNNQSAGVGEAVSTPPAVIVRDASSNPVPNVSVDFEVTGGGGEVTPGTVPTGSNGIAAVTSWTLGPAAGPNTMTATVAGLTPVTFDATANATGTTTDLSADPGSSVAGDPVTFTATVTGSGGPPGGVVSFRDGVVEIGQGTLNVAGVATFQTSSLAAGAHPITAQYLGNGTFGPSTSNMVNYSVAASNVAPTAQADAFNVNEDATLTVAADGVLGNDVDTDSDDLTAQLVTGPSNGQSFTLNPDGSFSYTPESNFNGSDSFTYRANDGQANSNNAVVTISVLAVNDPPTFSIAGDVTTSSLVSSVVGESHDGWASGISPGPADEIAQTVTFQISTDADDAFQTPPEIDSAGNLTYQPTLRIDTLVVNATITATDSGGATSPGQSFTITITP